MAENSSTHSLASFNSSSSGYASSTSSTKSLHFSLLHQQLLRIVSSNQPISSMQEAFYLTLAKERFPFASNRASEQLVLDKAQEYARELMMNMNAVCNVQVLMTRFCILIHEYDFQRDPSVELLNISSYLCIFCRPILSQSSQSNIQKYFSDSKTIIRLFESLCKVIVKVAVKSEFSLQLVVESLRLLVILLSEQIVSGNFTSPSYLHKLFSSSSIPFSNLFFRLLTLARLQNDIEESSSFSLTYTILHPLSSLFQPKPLDASYLSQLSLHFLALISVQKENLTPWTRFIRHWDEQPSLSSEPSYKNILDSVVMFLETLSGAILFYELIYRSQCFRNLVLSRTDPDFVLLPILKVLYSQFLHLPSSPVESTSHSDLNSTTIYSYSYIYVSLISLVLLTSDLTYVETLMDTTLSYLPTWFINEHKSISNLSLGSLLTFIILKIMQVNLMHDRDSFLHMNAVAILANVSRRWKHMHAFVALKFVNWFESISKRYLKLREASQSSLFTSDSSILKKTYSKADLIIYSDILTLILSVFHCALHTSFIRYNPHLICALLHKEAPLEKFSNVDEFSDLVDPLLETLEYFKSNISSKSITSDKLYQHVLDSAKAIGSSYPIQNRLDEFAFEFTENSESDAFFIPIAWGIILKESCAWNPLPTPLRDFEYAELHAVGSVFELMDVPSSSSF